MHPSHRIEQDRYAVILAGGDATRLMPLTRRITGRSIPKQFCPLLGERTLLGQTRHRVGMKFGTRHTMVVLTHQHEEFYRDQVNDLPDSNLVVQPKNRGTAIAILYALLRIAKLNPSAVVAVFPSDHYVDSERRFMSHVDMAMQAATFRRSRLILLGMKPDRTESDYGWIEAAEKLGEDSTLLSVRRFWEKPPKAIAQMLWHQGCLWNSFVMAGTVLAFLTMTARSLPGLKRAFASMSRALGIPDEQAAMQTLYAALPSCDFSREVLARNAQSLAVVPVEDVFWNDLGDPRRVYQTLARNPVHPIWMSQPTPTNGNHYVCQRLPRMRSIHWNANNRLR
jgi:mannose-1-phosphate guanylyltransferase